ncbi:MAG: cytochrome bd ubiquinol oxidase subunit [Solirubrobacteraceae bacterium]|jgi:cytochrome d ubiquinol oxidase subunit I|nr:cytochrome bd ubiquinol oxidase subunit [Solirubrobacteraceae bacterium]
MADPALLTLAAERVTGALGGAGGPDEILARRMQALSLAVHIPIVCFGIAFPAMILFVEGLYLRTGDVTYKALAKRWSKVAITIFAVGVVTGTILSFEFGLLWPNFMATFGAVFGVGFALEGVSFFIEAIFIAIYVYGWDRLPERTHFLTGIPIVITGFTGSFWVLGVNAWMNDPTGFSVVNGRVTDPKPWQALLAPNLGHELTHMYLAGYIVAGFIVAGVYATARLRGHRDRYHRAGLVVALSFAAFASGAQGLVGDWAGRRVAVSQPVKLAAFEGLPRTENGAPFTIGGYYDARRGEVRYGIHIPKMLSILAHHDPNAQVIGLDSVPPQDRPPVNIVRFAFQAMAAIGTGLALLGLWFVGTFLRFRRLPRSVWFYRAVTVAGPLALVALIAGWIATEVGRQPWIVYGVMRTKEAVTRSDGLEAGFVFLVVVYVGLAAAVAWLLRRLAGRPPETEVARSDEVAA